jgi:neutral ceramidase
MYQAGWDKQEIAVKPDGYAMFGYGMWHHRARTRRTALFARAVCLRDDRGHTLLFCCLDLGYVSHAVREGVCAALRERLGDSFDEAALVLTCTHTHSGPGGCSHEALYNLVTPGFVTSHLRAVVAASADAIVAAWRALGPVELRLHQGAFADEVEVAWNRSLRAYNRNPEVVRREEREAHRAVNRSMQVLSLRRDGKLQALVSWFGVHATCLSNSLEAYDADNKGYAAVHTERALREAGAAAPVAIFAQGTAGDVSPHYHGPAQVERRAKIKGEAEYAYAERNGRFQSERALTLVADPSGGVQLHGELDTIFGYTDFASIKVDPHHANGRGDACTSEPCHGVAFFQGTPVDGPGIAGPLAAAARTVAGLVRRHRLRNLSRYTDAEQAYYRRLYAAQGDKAILLETGRKRIFGWPIDRLRLPGFIDPTIAELKRQTRRGAIQQSALVPTVLPLQIVVIGTMALVCVPGEFTTTAGVRLIQTVRERLTARGVGTVLICTYCNDYMGYVTTREEYQAQAYEGGHTIFGQWTLGAFQTRLDALAVELCKPAAARAHDRTTRPLPIPGEELARRQDLPAPGARRSWSGRL